MVRASMVGCLVATIQLGVTWWKSAGATDLAQKQSIGDLKSLQGTVVTMKGYVNVGFEADTLCFDAHARRQYNFSRAIWINFAEDEPSPWMMGGLLSGTGVVRGTLRLDLSGKGMGHLGGYDGELDHTEILRLPILPLLLRTGAYSVMAAIAAWWLWPGNRRQTSITSTR
jgi:hypothetical protein